MKFSCTQENLSNALRRVVHIASQNVNLPILNNILLQTNEGGVLVQATDLEIGASVSMRAKVEEKGSITVPARIIGNYIELVNSERIDVELKEATLFFKAGKNIAEIKGEKAEDYPVIPTVEKKQWLHMSVKESVQSLSQTVGSASLDESRPEINGVLLHPDHDRIVFAATDSHRLSESIVFGMKKEGVVHDAILPIRCVQEVLKMLRESNEEMVTVFLNDQQILFETPDFQLFSRLIDAKFIEYQHVVPKEFKTTVQCGRDELIKAVKLSSLFSRPGILDIHFSIQPKDQTIVIRTQNVQIGQNASVVDATIEGIENAIVFNCRYLMDGLSNIKTDKVVMKMIDHQTAALFLPYEQNTMQYVLMPIKQ